MNFSTGDFATGIMILIVWALIATVLVKMTRKYDEGSEFTKSRDRYWSHRNKS